MRKTWWVLGGLGAIVLVLALFARVVEHVPEGDEYAQRLAEGIAEQRAEAGLPPLQWSECLTAEAGTVIETYMQSLRLEAALDTVDCDGADEFTELPVRTQRSPEDTVATWMSTSHRRDLVMNPADGAIGIACVRTEVDIQRTATCSVVIAPSAPDLDA